MSAAYFAQEVVPCLFKGLVKRLYPTLSGKGELTAYNVAFF